MSPSLHISGNVLKEQTSRDVHPAATAPSEMSSSSLAPPQKKNLAHARLQTAVDHRFARHVTHLEVCESVNENRLVSVWVDCFTDVGKLPSCTVREKCDGAHLLNLQ